VDDAILHACGVDDIESIFPDHLSTNCVLRLDHFYQAIVGNFWQAPKHTSTLLQNTGKSRPAG